MPRICVGAIGSDVGVVWSCGECVHDGCMLVSPPPLPLSITNPASMVPVLSGLAAAVRYERCSTPLPRHDDIMRGQTDRTL
jgi:hypothetical protein